MTVTLIFVAAAAFGQGEFFLYQSPCQVTADGSLNVLASVTGAASGSSTDSASFVATFPIPSTTDLQFSDSGEADANLKMSFNDGCTTDASSSIEGATSYSFNGDASTMVFGAGSSRSHADKISRGATGGPGTQAGADSEYSVPQLDSIDVVIPFQVAGGDNGVLTVEAFDFRRVDTGPTTGSMVAAWQIFTDVNGNCQLDFPADQAIGGDAGIVFPNDTYSAPRQTIPIPRNNYILWLTYFAVSNESVPSADCSVSASASSDVRDEVVVRFRLN